MSERGRESGYSMAPRAHEFSAKGLAPVSATVSASSGSLPLPSRRVRIERREFWEAYGGEPIRHDRIKGV
jgi:hypothetical protein